MYYDTLLSPFGEVYLLADDLGLRRLTLEKLAHPRCNTWIHSPEIMSPYSRQLDEYFAGVRRTFDLKLAPEGTVFQKQVWQQLQSIPFGETLSAEDIAEDLGMPHATQAVRMAANMNPIPIIIPCHRLTIEAHLMTEYRYGESMKKALLEMECGKASMVN